MKKFVYKCKVTFQTEEDLNRLGNDGWELVIVLPPTSASSSRYIFKREKS
jgi:hypothetical protein